MEEIKASDIVVGNYLLVGSDIGKVLIINGQDEVKFDNVYLECEEEFSWFEINRLRGIPLTEDVLLKCGGKRFDEDKIVLNLNNPSTSLVLMRIGTHWYPQIEQTGEFISDGVNTVYLNFIDYAHEAQNLFKALTKTDLIVKI